MAVMVPNHCIMTATGGVRFCGKRDSVGNAVAGAACPQTTVTQVSTVVMVASDHDDGGTLLATNLLLAHQQQQ